ncbi:MAG: DUF4855 domain-containing protein [Eubacteriales bacterium]|nr:DUF4855 domain-containing protein [Eubacteriales bacterium]MDD4476408.1 DUF4855 domain-containing protein [Eubacteriales bacterium]
MKKTALLLAFIMLLTFMVGSCENNDGNSSSADTSSVVSEIESQETSDDGKIKPQYETNVSADKPYTAIVAASESYPDVYGKELTDGMYASSALDFSDPKFCAWNSDNIEVIIDLGEVFDKLYKFEVSYLSVQVAGIYPLGSSTVQYSEDGSKFVNLGSVVKPAYEDGTIQKAAYTSTSYIKARYVKFILRRASAWLFLDELTVYADILDESKNVKFLENMLEDYNSDSKSNTDRVTELNSVSNELVDRSKTKILISKNKNYTISRASFDDIFADDGKKLTNGNVIGSLYESGDWVGFTGKEALDITVDLGKVYNDLSDFEISFFNNMTVSVSLPDYVTIYVSDDNAKFVEVGRIYGASDRDFQTFNMTLHLTYGVSGRYVKFAVSGSGFDKYYIEESAVYRYGTELEAKDSVYPDIVLPKITKEEFWSSSVADYSKNQNLILGKQAQIYSAVSLDSAAAEYNSPVTAKMLTDGKYSTNLDIHNGVFFKFNRGAHREVIFDLEKTSTVNKLTASFNIRKEWGVIAPPIVNYFLSDDGVNWYLVGKSSIENTDKAENKKVELILDKAVKARFVRFSFTVEMWVGCDELEVYGTKKASSSTKSLSSLGIEPMTFLGESYLKPSENVLGGVRDIMLSYHCNYADEKNNPTSGYMSVEQYMPYVAYVDKEGKIVDIMFDGYLFLPTSAAFPSGGYAHKDSTKSDWSYVLDNMFKTNYNMDALNQAAQKVKDELKLDSSYKYKVYAALLYPTMNQKFGDIYGDGSADTFKNNQQRIDAVKWYINEFYSRFNSGNYANLEFAGFYWHHETMDNGTDELVLLNGVADYVHEKGTQFFWIPYYLSNGYSRFSEFGFDFACMQPNYAFKENAHISFIENTALITKMYNMCVEMEIDPKALYNDIFYKRWMEYLKGGVYYGYMEALHMYYQGGMPGAFHEAALSDDPRVRLVYDYTYDFIKHKLKLIPDKLADVSFEAEKDKPFTGTLNSGKNVEITEYRLNLSARNGTVTINNDGSFIYYPNKGFTGTDTFMYEYSEQLDYSEGCKVTITVK